MQHAGLIAAYVDRLAGELKFDASLSRCVRQEVEDHLWEAAADSAASTAIEAQQRAIANFGDARMIAAQFALISLAKHSRRVSVTAILVIACVFIAMKARLTFYAATQWTMSEDVRAVSAIVGSVDRYAFWLSVIIGLSSLAYITRSRIPASLQPEYRRQLRRFFILCTAATGALVVSVISDGVLTALLLRGTEFSMQFLVPIFSMAIEIACVGVLALYVRSIHQRAASTTPLLNR
jgi:hypothetical protein